ncbi:MAG: RNA polymerase sigma factor [Sedimentisphaerales bacterium]|nr:RNA polymerase sigma factor [Sedimentisphaerales bacterium]
MTESTDANLVAAALRGDAESFSRLCEHCYPALVAIAYSRLAERHLAEDAAQKTLLAAYRDIARLKKPEKFAGWLTAICRNVAADMVKTRARQRHAEIEDCGPVLHTSHHENDTVAVVREILLRLEPEMRDIIYLRYYNQMSYARIAGMLGIGEEAVNGKLRRARDRIRDELQRRASMESEP